MRKLGPHSLLVSLLAIPLAFGCSGGGDDSSAAPDANQDVVSVTCPGAPAATFVTSGFAYSPTTATVSVGDIVEFHPGTGHDVNDANNAFHVGLGGDACFQFMAADSYTFHCSIHNFEGTLNVQ
jgi:plastocyanin